MTAHVRAASYRHIFPGLAISVPTARLFVGHLLTGLPVELVTRATLLVSELATNAVQHGSGPFQVVVNIGADLVRVEVTDNGEGEPVLMDPPPSVAHGRGLRIVSAFAQEWGVEHRSPGPGKSVWFEIPSRRLPAAASTRSTRQGFRT